MRISVRHTTRYRYDGNGSQIVQHLRLTPFSHPGQKILDWKIEAPGIEGALSYTDACDNVVHLLTQQHAREDYTITARGTVETEDKHGIIGNLPETMPASVYLRQTDVTRPNAGIRRLAAQAHTEDAIGTFHNLMEAIRHKVKYRVGITETHLPAAEALTIGEGVCQDHAHIFISAARHLGYPARYVSGYLLLDEDSASEAHHAWAEVRVDHIGWVGFDVSNGICPTDHHIRLTVGLDSHSAAPIRGIRWGVSDEEMDVEVNVDKVEQQQQ